MANPIHFAVPVAMRDVIDRIGPRFESETGEKLALATMLNPEVPAYVASGAPWSIAASNPTHIETIVAKTGALGPFALGGTPLALGMRVGRGSLAVTRDRHGIAALLRDARSIAVTVEGTSGKTFDRLLDVLDLRTTVGPKLRRLPGGGPMAELLAGRIEVVALPLTNIALIEGVRAKAVCPRDLDVHIDLALCLYPEADGATRRFAKWLTDPSRDEELAELGLTRSSS